ncbi:hypothetical protein NKG95_33890 [Mesorhizobium sp. M1423]|uniref:hypothetical protein n=1 Tax=Mesorhizobium sp. M1423 TaxID=2957101 RepID=UPI00333D5232
MIALNRPPAIYNVGRLMNSTNPTVTQVAKYDGFGKVDRQDVTIGMLTDTTTSVRDATAFCRT